MNAGGTLLSLFGIVTGFAYMARAFQVLYNVPLFEEKLVEHDFLKKNDDGIWYEPLMNLKSKTLILLFVGCSTSQPCLLDYSSWLCLALCCTEAQR